VIIARRFEKPDIKSSFEVWAELERALIDVGDATGLSYMRRIMALTPGKSASLPHTTQLSGYLYSRIDPDDIVDALHASHHSMPKSLQATILNDWDRFIRGINYNGKEVDIFLKDGRVVITEAGNKTRVITAYGREFSKPPHKPIEPMRWHFRNWDDGEFYFSPIRRNNQR
jgi:hypothetical protein